MQSVNTIAGLPADHSYVKGLDKTQANHVAFSPISFLERSALVFPKKTAIIHGALRQNWLDTLARSRQLASGLQALGIKPVIRWLSCCQIPPPWSKLTSVYRCLARY